LEEAMRVLLGVTGGIAAYKAADLVSRLVKLGDSVRVVMTPGATHFVGPITFEAMSGHPVMLDPWATGSSPDGVSSIEHIRWAKWADLAIVAPLTANTLSKLATGIADDALTTVWMALRAETPSLLCPAMNTAMWEQPVIQRNLRWLDALERHILVAPSEKRLACGDVGVGGLAEVDDILAAIEVHRD
jgi:phosphopantothenoylcysteine decarboxylase/phosphopantothenate--cysteine ligase